jgi:hypothetical protein
MATPQTHTEVGTTEVWASLGWNRNVIGMVFAHGKGGFCAILEGDILRRVRIHGDRLPLSFSETRDQVGRKLDGWRRLPEWEKGKENGGAGDRALGR